MLKIGQYTDNTEQKTYIVFWSENSMIFERLDLIEDASLYNVIDTRSCISSYYRQNKELVYGNKELIKKVFKIKHDVLSLRVNERKETKIDEDGFRLITTKENEGIGVSYELILLNGRIESEHFETKDGTIDIMEVSYSDDSSFVPINIDMYDNYGIMDNLSGSYNNSISEYYTYDELIAKYPQVLHVLDNDYVVVESEEQAKERLNEWINSTEHLKSVDIETTGTDLGIYTKDNITGIILGDGETRATYFPVRQDVFDFNLPVSWIERLFDAVNNQPPYPTVIILGHNLKFEEEGFYNELGRYLRVDVDTFILAVLLNPIIRKGTHTLKAITNRYEGKFYLSLELIFKGKVQFNVLPPDIVKLYACPDGTSPAKIYKEMIKELPKDEHFILNLENSIIPVKAMNEFFGIRIDQGRLKTLIENEKYKIERLSNMFKQIHNTSQNINSNKVLGDIIYNKLKCPVEVRTPTGQPSTSVSAIKSIVEHGRIEGANKYSKGIYDKAGKEIISGKELSSNKYPSLVIYQAYKKCIKELGALNRIKAHSIKDVFKFYINQVGAGSNRQTSDAHQFSDTMKSCVIADSPYHGLVSCDYAQVELRVLAYLAKQKDLIELQTDPEIDVHRAILSIITGKEIWDISLEERKAGKPVNFGVVYLMTEYGLAKTKYGPKPTKEQIIKERQRITDFYNSLPYIKTFIAKNREFLLENGFIRTEFGYYRFFPDLLDPTCDTKLKESMIKAGNNTPVQGFAATLMKMAERNVFQYIRKKGWDKLKEYDGVMLPMVRMILPIHDEILLSYDKEEISKEEVIKMFKECMEIKIKDAPPFFAPPAFIDNWLQGKSPKYEIPIPLRDKIVEELEKGNYLLKGRDYLEVLTEYNDAKLKNYIEDLISEYKIPKNIADHVRDPGLTHVLIETYVPEDELKSLTHRERILKAVENYIEKQGESAVINIDEYKEDKELKEMGLQSYEDLTSYFTFDENGEVIIEEPEYDTEEDRPEDDIWLSNTALEEMVLKRSYVIFGFNKCFIDLTGLDLKIVGEEIHKVAMKYHDENEFYEIVYLIGEKQYPSKIRVAYKIKEMVSDIEAIINTEGERYNVG